MLQIICDSREQQPLDFRQYDAEVVRTGLKTGDYSVLGFENRIALERKGLDDLVGCLMGDNRRRFERELTRARELEYFAVVCEADLGDIAGHRYRSQIRPHAVMQSILAFSIRHRAPFIWAGDRARAAYIVYWLLQKFQREHENAYKAKETP